MLPPYPGPSHTMVHRVAATQATIDRFRGKVLAFGSTDCARIAAFHLRQFGYKPQLAKAGAYRSFAGAVRALKRLGFDTLGDALDALGLERIAPAAAVVGDLLELPGERPGALVVAVGNSRVFGHHEASAGAVVMQPSEYVAAWRVQA